jgi:hypothetical protein
MASVAAVQARCPLCGVPLLSIGRGGRVQVQDLHPVPLFKDRSSGEGYMLCDECAMLAELPHDITLN